MQFLHRLLRLGKAEPDAEPPASKEVVQPQSRLKVGWATDVGRVRSHNEDTALVITAAHDGYSTLPEVGLFVLADGMGGHQSGEVASSLAARAVAHYITREFYLPALIGQDRDTNQPALRDVLIDAVRAANDIVAERVPGGGTTLTCALMLDLRAYIAHVGDSRAYIVTTEGKLDQITHDHSLVDRLVELGQLTPDEAAIHPQKNVLYRAVGQGGDLDVDTYMRTISAGEKLLLCSDGLWGIVDEAKMAKIITSSSALQAACEKLVAAANQAGGRDNITVILAEPPAG
ncbi:MAG: Stp1/IreP family PP2C-type Ser/Thr phosphatase [Anaerolineae bacterium]|nr:Stp1/IreP family PP2C-type Ser/Thr phosphatase [Anaerolineae bacterium]